VAATGVVVALVVGATLLELDVHADQVLAVELLEVVATTGLVVVLVVLALEVVGLTDELELLVHAVQLAGSVLVLELEVGLTDVLELPHAVQASSRL